MFAPNRYCIALWLMIFFTVFFYVSALRLLFSSECEHSDDWRQTKVLLNIHTHTHKVRLCCSTEAIIIRQRKYIYLLYIVHCMYIFFIKFSSVFFFTRSPWAVDVTHFCRILYFKYITFTFDAKAKQREREKDSPNWMRRRSYCVCARSQLWVLARNRTFDSE